MYEQHIGTKALALMDKEIQRAKGPIVKNHFLLKNSEKPHTYGVFDAE
jgi:hypothetical protein